MGRPLHYPAGASVSQHRSPSEVNAHAHIGLSVRALAGPTRWRIRTRQCFFTKLWPAHGVPFRTSYNFVMEPGPNNLNAARMTLVGEADRQYGRHMITSRTIPRHEDEPFQANPSLLPARRGASERELERLKERLLLPILKSAPSAALGRELRWVANESAALAWFTVCPLLVLPTLLEERVRLALQRWERQQNLRQRAHV